MAKQITQTLEFSRLLLRVYSEHGLVYFERVLGRFARRLARDLGAEAAELNSRYLTILSGILSVVYGSRTELIIRQQLKISEPFLNAADPEGKQALFTRGISSFFQQLEEEQRRNRFSDEVLYHLRSCPLAELRQLTVESLAEHFHYGQSRFSAKFRSERGATIQECVSLEKLHRAAQLLQEQPGKLTIREVATAVGFSDIVYFSRLFKKTFGMLPSGLRRLKSPPPPKQP